MIVVILSDTRKFAARINAIAIAKRRENQEVYVLYFVSCLTTLLVVVVVPIVVIEAYRV